MSNKQNNEELFPYEQYENPFPESVPKNVKKHFTQRTFAEAPPYELVLESEDTMRRVEERLHQLPRDTQSVLLVLPKARQALYAEEDFIYLQHLQHASQIPAVAGFVIPAGNEGALAKDLAFRYGFPFAESREAALDAWRCAMHPAASSSFPHSVPRTATQSTLRAPLIRVLLAALAIITASGLGAFVLAQHTDNPSLASAPPRVGRAAFVSSSHGINDEVQLLLPSMPTLPAGKVYTVWMISDKKQSDTLWLSLGTVKADGSRQTLAPSDGSHMNLLAAYSKVCITVSGGTLLQPMRSDCRYYGEITQKPNDNDLPEHYSLLDHARHLLASDPTLESLGIHNGLVYNFNAQLAKVNEWSSASVGTTGGDMPLVHRHMIRILDALDGSRYVEKDVPVGTGLMVDATSIQVGVLRGDASAPSYLGHIVKHLRGILNSPDVTAEQVRNASHILEEMQHIADDLANVYSDARSLVRMSDAQLEQATGTLQDMAANASNAYAGGYDTALAQTRIAGSKDLYVTFQQFGIIDIYKA